VSGTVVAVRLHSLVLRVQFAGTGHEQLARGSTARFAVTASAPVYVGGAKSPLAAVKAGDGVVVKSATPGAADFVNDLGQ
jgi:hypothetical protein